MGHTLHLIFNLVTILLSAPIFIQVVFPMLHHKRMHCSYIPQLQKFTVPVHHSIISCMCSRDLHSLIFGLHQVSSLLEEAEQPDTKLQHHIPEASHHEIQVQFKSNSFVSAFMPDLQARNALGKAGEKRKKMIMP
jgi:hypothetical protein